MQSGFLLDVIVGEGTSILELLSGENQTLLIGRNAFLILDLRLDIIDSVARLNLKSDGLSSEGLDDYKSVVSKKATYFREFVWFWVYDSQICIPPRRRRTR